MPLFSTASRDIFETVFAELRPDRAATVEDIAQRLVARMTTTFQSIVLCRLFLVVPYAMLPLAERAPLPERSKLGPTTPVISLLGSAGREEAWNDRTRSAHHRAVALLSASSATSPVLAHVLAGRSRITESWSESPIAIRDLAGGEGRLFLLADAREDRDDNGRPIIEPSFANAFGVRGVFGVCSTCAEGITATLLVFTDEGVSPADVEQLASVIAPMRHVTAEPLAKRRIWS